MTASRIGPVKGPGKPMLKTGWRLVMGASLLLLVQVHAEEVPDVGRLPRQHGAHRRPSGHQTSLYRSGGTYRESGQQEAQISSGAHLIV
jgi:hypothetical protein